MVEAAEQGIEGRHLLRLQNVAEGGELAVRGFADVVPADDFPVFQVGDEHRLHQQGLGRLRHEPQRLQPTVGLLEVVEQRAVHPLVGVEPVVVFLPIAAGLHAVDQAPHLDGVPDPVQHLYAAVLLQPLLVTVRRHGGEGIDADAVAADDGEDAGKPLIPQVGVQRRKVCRVRVPGGKEHGHWRAFDAKHRIRTQIAQRRSDGSGMGHIADGRCVGVELRRVTGTEPQCILPILGDGLGGESHG